MSRGNYTAISDGIEGNASLKEGKGDPQPARSGCTVDWSDALVHTYTFGLKESISTKGILLGGVVIRPKLQPPPSPRLAA